MLDLGAITVHKSLEGESDQKRLAVDARKLQGWLGRIQKSGPVCSMLKEKLELKKWNWLNA